MGIVVQKAQEVVSQENLFPKGVPLGRKWGLEKKGLGGGGTSLDYG